ncbi:helix-turn-helix domain-containing protein [Spirosoma sp. HMF4905]|uniref:Helix-turn-helix domain-containing protein n=1 Tax=Spirosoma arboris TaxID=2682092 RepID=A0A7K1SJF7_9BACT|nr:helix-turn-helix domain-containing protein [Spirosoma arboris]MVM33940.1 helix-turn-helix domain-containing protein [Spirosoma arboris]
MRQKIKHIPLNPMADMFGPGIAIGKASVNELSTFGQAELRTLKQAKQSHRDDYHLFFLPEKGTISIEIDFQKYDIKQSSVIYIHPHQVHRVITFEQVTVSFWVINTENLHPEYLNVLADIAPAKPLSLTKETFSIISEAASLCLKLSERTNDKLYHSLLKDSCNTLVALVASQYVETSKPADKLSRFELITKAFKSALEREYATVKKPTAYAQKLNISTDYLNECVKNTTGHSVSYHIQQRVILEAKRLLYHSDRSVKEIAAELGYDDYPYFSRFFTKVTGITALTFRNRNPE